MVRLDSVHLSALPRWRASLWLTAALGALLVPVTPALAQDQESPAVEASMPVTTLDPVVVTADRRDTPVSTVGSSVSVVTAEALATRQTPFVADALRTVPGVTVSRQGGPGGLSYVRLRGMPQRNTKVLINGIDISDPSTVDGAVDFGSLLVTDVERIEVVRGAQSTLYGSDAVGGVVNIITRTGSGDPSISASAEYGSDTTWDGRMSLQGQSGAVSYAGAVRRYSSNGISQAAERLGNPENDHMHNTTAELRLDADVGNVLSLGAYGRYVDAHTELDGFPPPTFTFGDTPASSDQTQRVGGLDARFDLFQRLSNTLAVNRVEHDRDYHFPTSITPRSQFDSDRTTYSWKGVLDLGSMIDVVAGAEHVQENAGFSNTTQSQDNTAGYLSWQMTLNDALYLTLGGRVDDHDSFGQHNTWRATAAYDLHATGTRFHASGGTGFDAPTLFELYMPNSGFGRGNPNLQPEESLGYDAGIEQSLWQDRLMVDVTGFYNRVKNRIMWDPVALTYNNTSSYRAAGAELGGTLLLGEATTLRGSYTYTDSRNNDTGRRGFYVPMHEGSLTLAYDPVTVPVNGAITWRGQSGTYDGNGSHLAGYGVVDLAAAWEVRPGMALTARVENLFDQPYTEYAGYGTPGLTAYGGLKLTF